MHPERAIEGEEYVRVHQVAHQFGASCFAADLLLSSCWVAVEVDGCEMLAWTARLRRAPMKDDILDVFGPSAFRLTQRTGEHIHDRVRQRHVVVRPEPLELFYGHSVADEEDRQVADNLARWSHLDDVAEGHIDVGVGRAISGHRAPRPIASACSRRFVYWPPGISCR